jgi:3-hydroxyacyl-CoA dehydrogenase/enoyl-CoA hydratase/3-hydroxybutyryl-CoA epimerase/enoyl-CoA isomerase
MLFEGKAIQASINDASFVELVFDSQYDKINKFDKITLDDLRAAVDIIKNTDGIKGLITYSKKDKFIVGADITEFGAHFQKSEEEMVKWLGWCNSIFNDIEDLPYPTVSAIQGVALGGGCEMALSTDYRIIDPKGTIGLPEIGLGIMPGFGGTVRLPRLIGVDNALQIIPAGKSIKADAALKNHLVDAIVPAEKLVASGFKMLEQAVAGKLNWQ